MTCFLNSGVILRNLIVRLKIITNWAKVNAEYQIIARWLDEGDTVDIVYLDFAKAFDSVNHRLLLTNLKCYGIAPSVINWIESHL